ncbi:hypothetical protein INT48_000256 [Thamnidium elegans]|uniref:Uncharacterized protein n=1 Tax=Thamnidium elegans TaxID=101142 RepID=A0A8H7W1H2_9FUNG|nr:hypothetical protein INT48_000256 [Thamnidium elegans]
MDPYDPIWKSYFTPSELLEISSYKSKALEDFPEDLSIYLNSYDKEWESAVDLYNFADGHRHDLIKESERKWIKESILGVSALFLDDEAIALTDFSESDLLHSVWRFIYRAFFSSPVKAMLGERCSVAVAMGRNEDRSLEDLEKRERKSVGSKVDILFKAGVHELGSREAEKSNIVPIDDKYLNDGLMKLPKTLRDMLSMLVEVNPEKTNSLVTVGFLLMGLEMEVIFMDVPVGHSIARVSKSHKFGFPVSHSTITIDFIPLLEITWKGKKMMERTILALNDRKRKAATMMLPAGVVNEATLSFSFVRSRFKQVQHKNSVYMSR